MARWKLITSHYLNCPGTEWEQKEMSRETGKEVRKRYTVPRFLNVDDPGDWTVKYRNDLGQVIGGDIVICLAGQGEKGDIEFVGVPTPDMEPLDDGAEEISAGYRDRWSHPIEDLPTQGGYGDALIQKMEQVMSLMLQSQGGAVSSSFIPAQGAVDPIVEQLLRKVEELTLQVARLSAGRQEEDAPLEDAEPTAEELAESAKAAQALEQPRVAQSRRRG